MKLTAMTDIELGCRVFPLPLNPAGRSISRWLQFWKRNPQVLGLSRRTALIGNSCAHLQRTATACVTQRAMTRSDYARVSAAPTASPHQRERVTQRQGWGYGFPRLRQQLCTAGTQCHPHGSRENAPAPTIPITSYRRCNSGISGERERGRGRDFSFHHTGKSPSLM